jgi:hypothetical protein
MSQNEVQSAHWSHAQVIKNWDGICTIQLIHVHEHCGYTIATDNMQQLLVGDQMTCKNRRVDQCLDQCLDQWRRRKASFWSLMILTTQKISVYAFMGHIFLPLEVRGSQPSISLLMGHAPNLSTEVAALQSPDLQNKTHRMAKGIGGTVKCVVWRHVKSDQVHHYSTRVCSSSTGMMHKHTHWVCGQRKALVSFLEKKLWHPSNPLCPSSWEWLTELRVSRIIKLRNNSDEELRRVMSQSARIVAWAASTPSGSSGGSGGGALAPRQGLVGGSDLGPSTAGLLLGGQELGCPQPCLRKWDSGHNKLKRNQRTQKTLKSQHFKVEWMTRLQRNKLITTIRRETSRPMVQDMP